ncbi:hypothetical protein PWT90_05402 [Aphanocladium album]|nr:hypothetical protein PWT90_05402 [Aphanocladium album]
MSRPTPFPSSPSSMGSARPTAAPVSPPSVRRKPVQAPHGRLPSFDTETSAKLLMAVDIAAADEKGAYPTKARNGKAHVLSLWKWELVSLLISILSFLAIVITLLVYQNRLTTEWKLPISINAIVAILSALFKGSLAMPVTEGISQMKWLWFSRQPRSLIDMDLYDRASRGAWGAFLMILKQFKRGPKSFLASFGAFLALVALAVDPFSQASVTLKPCWRAVDNDASIPRAINYAAHGPHSTAGVGGYVLDPPMSLAAYMGVLKPPANSSVSVPVSCRTNNCTFPSDQGATFSTLGVRVLSWDISDQVVDLRAGNELGWNYTLSWGINIGVGELIGVHSDKIPSTSFLPEGEGPWNRTSLVDVQLLGVQDKNNSCTDLPCGSSADIKPAAYMFSLLPCVQTFAANFTDGIYTEELIEEQDLHMVSYPIGYQLALNKTLCGGKWQDCVGTAQRTDTNTVKVYALAAQDVIDSSRGLPVESWHRPECVYSIRQEAASAIANFIGPSGFFNDNERLQFGNPGEYHGKPWIENLWNHNNMSLQHVTDFAQGLARSISAQMRINPGDKDEAMRVARGVTWEKETCIIFEWKWLIFLAALLVLEMAFFVTVVVVNYKSRWGADWKSSTLAVAYQNVGSATSNEAKVSEPELDKHLREAAKTTKVSFTNAHGQWQLRKEEGYSST